MRHMQARKTNKRTGTCIHKNMCVYTSASTRTHACIIRLAQQAPKDA